MPRRAVLCCTLTCRAVPCFATDMREALLGGISMFMTLARDDRQAEKAAAMAAAALRLRMCRLLLDEMVTLRAQGVLSWKKLYEQVSTLRCAVLSCNVV